VAFTRLTDRMEKADYVTRQRTAEDRRGAYAVITPKGKAELERIWPIHLRGIEQHFAANVDDADVPALYAALSRIIVGVEGPTSSYAAD
jgi:DNA-binding MarR family transcriptional regulator